MFAPSHHAIRTQTFLSLALSSPLRFLFPPLSTAPTPPLLPQLIFILRHVSIHALFQTPLTRAPLPPARLKGSWPLPNWPLLPPILGTRAQGVSYQGGFLLLLEDLHPGLEFFFGQYLGCPFNPLKLFGTHDKGLSRGILCVNAGTMNEQKLGRGSEGRLSPLRCGLLCSLPPSSLPSFRHRASRRRH